MSAACTSASTRVEVVRAKKRAGEDMHHAEAHLLLVHIVHMLHIVHIVYVLHMLYMLHSAYSAKRKRMCTSHVLIFFDENIFSQSWETRSCHHKSGVEEDACEK